MATHQVVLAAGALSLHMRKAVVDSRADGRRAAQLALGAETELLRRQLGRLGLGPLPDMPGPSNSEEQDNRWGLTRGESFARHWQTLSLTAIANSNSGHLGPALTGALAQAEPRIRMIAATEVARAFNDEHDEGVGYIATQHKNARWIGAFLRRWNAILDRATCKICRGHDGELTLPFMGFENGDKPAEVHPLCRCTGTMVFLPARLSGVIPGHYTGLEDEEAA